MGEEPGREDGVGGENIDMPVDGSGTRGGGGESGNDGGENASAAATVDPEGIEKIASAGAGHSRHRQYGDDHASPLD